MKEEYQGQGIGTQLLQKMKVNVQEEHLDGLELQVNARNAGARRMYAKLGFAEKSINSEISLALAGIVKSSILRDGSIVGSWKRKGRKVEITLFESTPPEKNQKIEEMADLHGRKL